MNKKEQIIEAATNLFSKYSYKKVSMDEIAKEANVTKKTIYSYFKDKNDLIKYIITKELQRMKSINDKIDRQDIPFIEKINNLILELIDYRTNSKILNAFREETNVSQIEAECSEIINKTINEELKQKIDDAIEKKYIKPCDSEIAAFIIYKIYVSLMFEWNKPIDKEKVSKNVMNILTSGLLN